MRYGGGTSNTIIGRQAGWKINGTGVTALGYQSGHTADNDYGTGAGTLFTGSNSTFIGHRAGYDTGTPTANNVIVIGTDFQPTLVTDNVYIGSRNDIVFVSDIDGTPLTMTYATNGTLNYGTDVSGSYTDRSHIDKGFADATYSPGGAAWVSSITTGTGTEIQNTVTSNVAAQTGTDTFIGIDWNITVGARSSTGDIDFLNFRQDTNAAFKVSSVGAVTVGTLTGSGYFVEANNGFIRTASNATALKNDNINTIELDASNNVTIPNGILDISGARSGTPTQFGKYIAISTSTFTDNNTAMSGTASIMVFNGIEASILAATNTSVTTTDAATFYIGGPPTAGTNQTITNSHALFINAGDITISRNTDSTAIFGRVRIDSRTTDEATFSHFNQSGTTVYALKQLSTGRTFINAASGQDINFRISNSPAWTIDSTGNLDASAGKDLNLSTTSEIQFGGTVSIIGDGSGNITIGNGKLNVTDRLALGLTVGDVATPLEGEIWYNDTINKFRAFENAAAVDMIGGGSAAGSNNILQLSDGASGFKAAEGGTDIPLIGLTDATTNTTINGLQISRRTSSTAAALSTEWEDATNAAEHSLIKIQGYSAGS
jgi:hypothetical protein